MKFRQFVPEYNAATREAIWRRERPGKTDEEIAFFLQAVAEESFIREKQPFYRLYPGVTEALTRLGIEKIDVSKIRPPVNPLSLEFPIDRPLIAGTRKITNILFMEFEKSDTLFIEYRSPADGYSMIIFPRENKQIIHLLYKTPEEDSETYKVVLQIVFGVCMIPQSDESLITPRVLNRDLEKFKATGDQKYLDRAKRNGVYGWDVGRDIPTEAEMETYRQQHGEPGRKSPHWRMGHFAIRRTGEGHTDKKIVWIKETFVNKNLLKEVPTGYHGAVEPTNDSGEESVS
jgi:hypothetical protein